MSVNVELDQSFFQERIVRNDFHADAETDLRDFLADAAEADNAQRFSFELNSFGIFFLQRFKFRSAFRRHFAIRLMKEAHHSEKMCEDQFSDGMRRCSRSIYNMDSFSPRIIHIDIIHSNTATADQL